MRRAMAAWALFGALCLTAGCSDEKKANCPNEGVGCQCSDGTRSTLACGWDGLPVCQCAPIGGSGAVGGTGAVGGSGAIGGSAGAGAIGGSGGNAGFAGSAGAGGVAGTGVGGAAGTSGGGQSGMGGVGAGGSGGTGAMGGGGASGSGGMGGSGGSTGACLQGAGGDYSAMGPYAVTQSDVDIGGGLGMYTIFRPTNLEASCKHPIVSWGNGTGVTGSNIYGFYQTHAASWGMVVIASHNAQAGSMGFIAGGIDHLLDQNADASSPMFNKLSDKAGTAGHSQGGFAATTATSHPNVVAEVCVQGGGTPPSKVAFMCLTGTEDFVEPQCTAGYTGATGPAFLANYQGADHNNTPTLGGFFQNDPGTRQYQRLYTAWFRCHLAGDQTACAMFRGGSSCGICSEPNWFRIEGKNF